VQALNLLGRAIECDPRSTPLLQQRRSAILQLLLAELVSSLAARMASGWLCDAPSMPKFQVRT